MDLPKTRTDLGREAEALVAEHLRRVGITVVATNLRLGYLEIDIVAREGNVVIVVEVRRRNESSRTSGFGSLGPKKRLFLKRAGERLWNRYFKNDPSAQRLRFDVAQVTETNDGAVTLEYVRGAFGGGGTY